MGLEVLCHPLFVAESVGWTVPAGEFDALLVTSANAVRLAGALPSLPAHCVGSASAQAARAEGLTVQTVGDGGVAALLARVPPGLRLLHLTGKAHHVPDEARQDIVSVPVYRMAPLPLPDRAMVEGAVMLVHSPAAGRRVAELEVRREGVRVAAISPAGAAACGPGWERCEAADEPSDSALLSLAAKLCEEVTR